MPRHVRGEIALTEYDVTVPGAVDVEKCHVFVAWV
jgi:hypothetical protein